MGYRTYHTLTVYEAVITDGALSMGNAVSDEIQGTLEEEIIANTDASFEDEATWYDCDTDMREFSSNYPQYIFKIHGNGEDQTDMWDTYYHDGKCQDCAAIITYPAFDPTQMS